MAKKYKCRVEYLESTGTQWIDTGVAVDTSTDEIKLYFQLTETQNYKWLFGEYDTNARIGLGSGDGENKRNFLYQQNATKVSDTQMYNTQHLFEINSNGGFLNGTKIRDYLSFASTATIYLFNLNIDRPYDYRCKSKIWGYRHKRNGVLIRDLIPVLDLSGKPAMYDQVSGQLFYNQGTGEFTYGRQIIPVEYLESTGTQYIDTGIDTTTQMNISVQFSYTQLSTYGILFDTQYPTKNYLGIRLNGNSPTLQVLAGNKLSTIGDITIGTKSSFDGRWNSSGGNFTLDGVEYTVTDADLTPASGYPIYIFAGNQQNSPAYYCYAKIYYLKISNGTTLVRDFIPCIDENNTPFMFDLVTNTCYLNSGTGQFKVGPNVEKVWGGKKLRRKLALALANLKKKRKYYCEVEYLESSGTQYIDTGIIPSSDMEFRTKINFTSISSGDVSVIAARVGGSNRTQPIFCYANKWTVAIGNTYDSNGASVSTNTDYDIKSVITEGKTITLYANGSQVATLTNAGGIANVPFYIFARNQDGVANAYSSLKMNYMKIYSDGVLVRDFIPVLDWDMTPCMYDKVTEQLFYNQGIGDFTAGREIHPVEYLESTGVEYIDTGIIGTEGVLSEIDVMKTTATTNECFLGTWNSGSARCWLAYAFSNKWYPGYGGAASDMVPVVQNSWTHIKTYITQVSARKYFGYNVNGTDYTLTGYFTSFTGQNTILMFAMNTNTGTNYKATGRIGTCKITKDGVLVRDYIPAIDENGVGFMFDRVTHTIYDNAGQGSFKYPAREVEYLTSDGNQYIDTGIQPTDDYGYKIRNTYTRGGGEQCAIGCMDNGNRFVGIYTSGSENQLSGAWGSFVGFLPTFAWATGDILDVEVNYKNSRKMIVNGTELKDISDIHVSGTVSNTIYLFARHYGGTITKMKGNVYGVEITNGQNVVADFIPAFKDGQIGMYDKVGGVLKTNIGSGTFTRGKIVEPEYE